MEHATKVSWLAQQRGRFVAQRLAVPVAAAKRLDADPQREPADAD